MQREPALRDDHIRLRTDDRVDLLRELRLGAVAPPRVDDEILPLGIAQLAHAAAERVKIRRRRIRAFDRCPGDAKRLRDCA